MSAVNQQTLESNADILTKAPPRFGDAVGVGAGAGGGGGNGNPPKSAGAGGDPPVPPDSNVNHKELMEHVSHGAARAIDPDVLARAKPGFQKISLGAQIDKLQRDNVRATQALIKPKISTTSTSKGTSMSNPADLNFQLQLLREMDMHLDETQAILRARMSHYEGFMNQLSQAGLLIQMVEAYRGSVLASTKAAFDKMETHIQMIDRSKIRDYENHVLQLKAQIESQN